MPAPEPRETRLQQILAEIRRRVEAGTLRLWDDLSGYDEQNVDEFVTRAVPIVESGQRTAVRVTDAATSAQLGRPPVGLQVDELVGAAVRNGTDPTVVYRRPFVDVWKALADGVPWEEALGRGRTRLSLTADTDVALSSRAAADQVYRSDPRVAGYRRVPDGKACTFCLVASTQRYKTGELMPLHPRCGCTTRPIIGQRDPGHILGREQLKQMKKLSDRPDYWNDRDLAVKVREHGELGPMLTKAGDKFTGPGDF